MQHRIITAATVAALTFTGLTGCAAISAAAARSHPTVTVTVTAEPRPAVTVTAEPTGVDQDTYDACKTAYQQVVTILAKQTTILQGVSFAASDGFNAVADGDVAGLTDAADRVSTYTGQENALDGDVKTIDPAACQ